MQTNAPIPPPLSKVAFIGVAERRLCGYCNTSGSHSFFLRAHELAPEDYQKLLDQGWRRSGHLLYRPILKKSCCVQYTIRLDATQYKPTREHRQTLNRWTKYVLGEEYIRQQALQRPKTKEEKKKRRNEFDLLEAVHAPEYNSLLSPPEPSRRLEVTIEASTFTPEKYELYKHYQITVHHDEPDEVTEDSFRRFLCHSPLHSTEPYPSDGSQRLGSFHQLYRLDGKLIAMSVLDFLPWCVSGVYFVYHTDFEQWGFGKLSACREAALALEEGYQFYYMGFYIHTCPKMRYKGQFHPTYFLDPEINEWCHLDEEAKEELDIRVFYSPSHPEIKWEYVHASHEEDSDDDSPHHYGNIPIWDSGMSGIASLEEIESSWDIANVKISLSGHIVTADMLVQFTQRNNIIRRIIHEFAASVGRELSTKIALSFG